MANKIGKAQSKRLPKGQRIHNRRVKQTARKVRATTTQRTGEI